MGQSRTSRNRPTVWTWVFGTILVVAIVWGVFAMISRKGWSHNERLPRAQIRAKSMVARVAPSYTAALSSAASSV